jgi:hypothetical protein
VCEEVLPSLRKTGIYAMEAARNQIIRDSVLKFLGSHFGKYLKVLQIKAMLGGVVEVEQINAVLEELAAEDSLQKIKDFRNEKKVYWTLRETYKLVYHE